MAGKLIRESLESDTATDVSNGPPASVLSPVTPDPPTRLAHSRHVVADVWLPYKDAIGNPRGTTQRGMRRGEQAAEDAIEAPEDALFSRTESSGLPIRRKKDEMTCEKLASKVGSHVSPPETTTRLSASR